MLSSDLNTTRFSSPVWQYVLSFQDWPTKVYSIIMHSDLFLSKPIFSDVVFVAELFLHYRKQLNSENSKQKHIKTPASAGTLHAGVRISIRILSKTTSVKLWLKYDYYHCTNFRPEKRKWFQIKTWDVMICGLCTPAQQRGSKESCFVNLHSTRNPCMFSSFV